MTAKFRSNLSGVASTWLRIAAVPCAKAVLRANSARRRMSSSLWWLCRSRTALSDAPSNVPSRIGRALNDETLVEMGMAIDRQRPDDGLVEVGPGRQVARACPAARSSSCGHRPPPDRPRPARPLPAAALHRSPCPAAAGRCAAHSCCAPAPAPGVPGYPASNAFDLHRHLPGRISFRPSAAPADTQQLTSVRGSS